MNTMETDRGWWQRLRRHKIKVLLIMMLIAGSAIPLARWYSEQVEKQALRDRVIAILISDLEQEDPEPLGMGATPGLFELVALGPSAIEPLLEIMLTGSEIALPESANDSELEQGNWGPENLPDSSRLTASMALNIITKQKMGFVWGQGWSNPTGREKWEVTLGQIHPDMPLAERQRMVQRYRDWLKTYR